MKVILPITVTDATLTSTNIVESEATEWLVGSTYALAALVYVDNTVYESQQAGNIGHSPATDDGTWWLETRATNPWKAFDKIVGSSATGTGNIQYVITPGVEITGIALLGIQQAAEAEVTVTDSVDGVVYNNTVTLASTEDIIDWYTYFFEDFSLEDTAVRLDLPIGYPTAAVTVKIYPGKKLSGYRKDMTDDEAGQYYCDDGILTLSDSIAHVEIIDNAPPSFYSSFTFPQHDSLVGSSYTKLGFKFRVTSGNPVWNPIFNIVWLDTADTVYFKSIPEPSNLSAWNILEVDMSGEVNWTTKSIKLVQLVLFESADNGSTYEVDWFEIYDFAEVAAEAKLGELVLGTVVDLGLTQIGASVGIIDYSLKETDDFGNISVLERAFSKRAEFGVIVLKAEINRISTLLATIRSIPVVWVALDECAATNTLVIYGYLKDYSMSIPHPIWGEMSLQLEGLI